MDTAPAAPASAPTTSAPAQGSAPSEAQASGDVSKSATPATTTAQEMYELKVDGKTHKLSRDELIKRAQLGMSAEERFSQSAKQRKEVEAIVGRFKSSPIEALLDPRLGLSKDQVRAAMEEWYTREFIEPEQMTPEQLELRNAREKLKRYEEQEAKKKAEAEEAQRSEMTAKQREFVQNQITEALDKSGLPKTRYIVGRMAFYMRENLVNGWDAPMEVIIDQVKKERQAALSDLTDSSDAEALINYLGENFVNKIRKHDLARLRAKKAGGIDPGSAIHASSRTAKSEGEKGPISYRDVNKNLRRLMQGK